VTGERVARFTLAPIANPVRCGPAARPAANATSGSAGAKTYAKPRYVNYPIQPSANT
jgi:hypothetical protein